jgi:hypothetical protein
LVEQVTVNHLVRGSSPRRGANLNKSDYLETGSRTCFLSDQMRE